MNEYKLKAYTTKGEYIEQSLDDFYEIDQFLFEIGDQLSWCIVVRWDGITYKYV
tara:strand:- start:11330 stop:11491 length:162 start_codon:yes stop_codon:yes gene_type:complete